MKTITSEMSPTEYASVIRAVAEKSDCFGLIVRPTIGLSVSAQMKLDNLAAFQIDIAVVDEWPGTKLHFGATAEMRRYRLEGDAIEILISVSEGPFGWIQPDLPEDLFMTRGSEVNLITVAHERFLQFRTQD